MRIETDPLTGAMREIEDGFQPSFAAQMQPSEWSCLPTAFAMVMSIPVAEVLGFLGHDDADCFHVQELLGFALGNNWAFIPFAFGSLEIDGKPHTMRAVLPVPWLMNSHNGVLTGLHNGKPHAVAWCSVTRKCFDPKGGVFGYDDPAFVPDCFWVGVKHV